MTRKGYCYPSLEQGGSGEFVLKQTKFHVERVMVAQCEYTWRPQDCLPKKLSYVYINNKTFRVMMLLDALQQDWHAASISIVKTSEVLFKAVKM